MSKQTDETAFQAARSAFLAHREDFLQEIATALSPAARLELETQYHKKVLPQYRQIFLTQVLADPSRRDELIRTFNADTGGERLWLTAKSRRKEAIRVAKFIKELTPKPQRQSRKERQRQKKAAATGKKRLTKKGLMNW